MPGSTRLKPPLQNYTTIKCRATPTDHAANYTDTFAYTIIDTSSLIDTATVTVVVTADDDVQYADDDRYSTNEDTILSVTAPGVLIGDNDVNSITAVFTDSVPYTGTLDLRNSGAFTYTPALNHNGIVTFTYHNYDGSSNSNIAVVTITVYAANDAPTVANPVPGQTAFEDTAFSYTFAANTFADVDAGDILTYTTNLTGFLPLPGWLSFDAATRNYSGTPLNADVGVLTLVLTATDVASVSIADTFVLTVTNTNDPPTFSSTFLVSGVGFTSNGFVSTDGYDVVYQPNLDFNGGDTFTYTVSDGSLSTAAVIAVTVTPVNDAPTAMDDYAATARNTPVIIDVKANDSDVDGDIVNAIAVGAATHGTAVLQSNYPLPVQNRKITYTPAQDFIGTDVFTYTLSDFEFSDTATVTVTVNPSGLNLTKTVSTVQSTTQHPILPGSLVTYTIQLTHAGGDTAQSVTMFDTLPAAVRFNEWIEGEQWGTLLLPDTILWGPHDVATDTVVVLRFTAVVTTGQDFYGQTVVNVAQYSSDNAGYGSDDASFEIKAAPSAGISFVSPSAGQLFTATNNVSATIPITVATTNFNIPDDGHWQLWVDGNDQGTVYGYVTTVALGLGTRVISAELYNLAHAPLGPVATVTITIESRVSFIYLHLPLVIKDE